MLDFIVNQLKRMKCMSEKETVEVSATPAAVVPANGQSKAPKKPAKPRVSNETLVTTYATSKSIEEVEKKTGLTKASIQTRINALIEMGVQIKKYERAKPAVDVAGLNKLLGVSADSVSPAAVPVVAPAAVALPAPVVKKSA